MTTVASSSDIRAAACRRGSLRRLPLGLLACRLCTPRLALRRAVLHQAQAFGHGCHRRAVRACSGKSRLRDTTESGCVYGEPVYHGLPRNVDGGPEPACCEPNFSSRGALPCLALTKYSCLLFRTRVVAEERVAQEGTRRRNSCGLRRLDSSLTGRSVDECKSPI